MSDHPTPQPPALAPLHDGAAGKDTQPPRWIHFSEQQPDHEQWYMLGFGNSPASVNPQRLYQFFRHSDKWRFDTPTPADLRKPCLSNFEEFEKGYWDNYYWCPAPPPLPVITS